MNSLIVFEDEFDTVSRVVLKGERARRCFFVDQFKVGQEICVAVYGGIKGRAKVERLSESLVEFSFIEQCQSLALRPVELVVGLSRPQTTKKVIQAAVMAGVKTLHLVATENGEKSYLDSHILRAEDLRLEVLKGLEQIWEGYFPEINLHRSFYEFKKNDLAAIREQPSCYRGIAIPGAPTLKLSPVGTNFTSAVFVVGPEAGWSEREVRAFKEHDFIPVGLGPRIVRVEIAVGFLLGQSLLMFNS